MDMRRNKFLEYLLVQFAVIIAVMIIFKVIPDRQIAATVAGFLFVIMPVGLMAWEYKRAGFEETIWFVGVLQFWTVFALPILGIRLFNWGVPFEQLSFWRISGPALHQWSSKSYMVMMAVTAIRWFKLRKKG
ncbi:MAG: hypothetical protein J7501_08985 [Bdellovibrio sp.]|nr:hypothetical protein [Bdellovibrio sp.]